jgi:hypothetical protein
MAERRIVDIGPLLEDLKKELEDLEGSTEALTVEEATEDEIGELEALPEMERLYLDGKIFPGELKALVMVSECLEREFIHRQLATGRPLHLNV